MEVAVIRVLAITAVFLVGPAFAPAHAERAVTSLDRSSAIVLQGLDRA